MTEPHPGTPLQIDITQDVSDGFRAVGAYDLNLARKKAGSLNIEQKQGAFEIHLIDKNFRKGRPAIINLNLAALFDVVQACRAAWDQAFESLAIRQRAAAGGQKLFRPYENAWDKPVDKDTFRRLVAKLAVAGDDLFRNIFEKNRDTPLDEIAAKLRNMACSGRIALTVHAAEFHIPWRLIYTHPDANKALARDGSNFEENGFWGYQHVIEQFTKHYDIRDHVLAHNGQLGFGAALHDRIDTDFNVNCIKCHREFIQTSTNRLRYTEWKTTAELLDSLGEEEFKHPIMYFLCHAQGAGSNESPSLKSPILELVGGNIDAVAIRRNVRNRFKPNPPLIFINACCGGQLGTLVKHNFTFASELLEQGALCVIGPQIEIPAVFAGEFGKCFFEKFLAPKDPPPLVGDILCELTREMWEHYNPFGLAYSLYAGSDCHVRWSPGGVM